MAMGYIMAALIILAMIIEFEPPVNRQRWLNSAYLNIRYICRICGDASAFGV